MPFLGQVPWLTAPRNRLGGSLAGLRQGTTRIIYCSSVDCPHQLLPPISPSGPSRSLAKIGLLGNLGGRKRVSRYSIDAIWKASSTKKRSLETQRRDRRHRPVSQHNIAGLLAGRTGNGINKVQASEDASSASMLP